MLEIINKENLTEKENINGQMAVIIKDNLLKEWEKDMEFGSIKTGQFMKDNLKMISKMEKENKFIKLDKDSKEYLDKVKSIKVFYLTQKITKLKLKIRFDFLDL